MSGASEPVFPPLRKMAARFVEHLRAPIFIVIDRFVTRPAFYPKIRWVIWVLAVLVLTATCVVFLDSAVGRQHNQWTPAFAAVADIFTKLGLGIWYLLPPLAWLFVANQIDWRGLSNRKLMAVYNRTSLSFFIFFAVGLPGVVGLLLKIFVGRARPSYYEALGILSSRPFTLDSLFASFPSGHATTMGSVAAILWLLFPRWKFLVLAIALWITSTRVFVSAHYPSDTVAGFALGFGLAVVVAVAFARLGFVFRQISNGLPVPRNTLWLTGPRSIKSSGLVAASRDTALSDSG